jgi:hypothetical protein
MVVSWRALSEHQFFHGTDRHFTVGEVISPAGESGGVNYPNTTDRRYAYATDSESNAWHYAETTWMGGDGQNGPPTVYEVAPLGRHSKDPASDKSGFSRGTFQGDRRSKSGWKILRQLPMPEHMGDPEDWR